MILSPIAFRTHSRLRLIGFVIVVSILCMAYGQDTAVSGLSRETAERLEGPGWWPTKGTAALSEYAGSAACAHCHQSISESQAQTPMFNAASRPAEASILRQHDNLQFSEGNYGYKMTRGGDQTMLVVENTWGTLSAPILWAMGNGEIGQTYLLKKNDTYFESRLSYFPALSGLDITPGHSYNLPNSLEQAVGMPQDPSTAKLCFGCHTTASTVSGVFNPERSTPGIGCEACHGPSAKHVKAEEQANDSVATPFNPGNLDPRDSVDFCGACHRTPADVAVQMPGKIGILGLRFSAYRLERSFCWGASGDARITCIACHDPHKPLQKDSASYDSKCLQCHSNTGHPSRANQAPACTVASKDCASCHMPKYELKIAHTTLTDHYIRIVRAGSGYRD
jgi:Cytochrome c554 and c-prime